VLTGCGIGNPSFQGSVQGSGLDVKWGPYLAQVGETFESYIFIWILGVTAFIRRKTSSVYSASVHRRYVRGKGKSHLRGAVISSGMSPVCSSATSGRSRAEKKSNEKRGHSVQFLRPKLRAE